MKSSHALTQQRLQEVLTYDSATGAFHWRVSRGGMAVGDVAGKVSTVSRELGGGYRWISVDGKKYRAHRLAWLYVKGSFPDVEIDHRNRDRADNRFANFRLATHAQNQANAPMRSTNTSGLKGASLHKTTGRWRATLGKKHLGYFGTAFDAHMAYVAAAKTTYGEFASAS